MRLAVRLVRTALLLLPRRLRDEIGPDVLETFRARARAIRSEGRPGRRRRLAALVARELAGLVRAAVRARRPDPWTRRTAPATGRHTRSSTLERLVDHLRSDLRFALRSLTRRPGMMGLAALSLALGIGASTAMFGVVDSVLLRPLSFDDPDELVAVYPSNPDFRGHPTLGAFADRGTFSLPEVFWVAENQEVFEAFGAFVWDGATLSGDEGPPEWIDVLRATPGVLPALGVQAVRGRLFSDGDDPREGGRSVLLTRAYWEARFAADPGVVGSTIRLDDEPWTVVGILPDRVAEVAPEVDAWTLLTGTSAEGNWGNHGGARALARLADGVGIERARAELERIIQDVPADNDHGHGASVFPHLQDRTRTVRPALVVLVGAALLLLAVGCGNVAAILLGAGIEREQEIAVRGALGADRGRLARQLLTESLVLAGIGAVGGLVLAAVVTEGLLYLAPSGIPRIGDAAMDGRVLAFAVAVSMGAGVFFGTVPALTLSRPDMASALGSTRGATSGRTRLQAAVVVGELALATVLLVGAGLMGRTLLALDGVDLGIATENRLLVRLVPPFHRLADGDPEALEAAVDRYFQGLVDGIAGLPGVRGVAVTSVAPLTGDRANNEVTPEGWDAEAEGEQFVAERRFVSPDYFETAGIPVVEGRSFDARDDRHGAAPTMIISEGLARRAWPTESAVGKRISFWGRDPSTVVGVAADVRDEGLAEATTYAFYVPARQVGAQVGSLLVWTRGDPLALAPTIRQRVWAVDPDVAIPRIATFDELVSDQLLEQRYRARLMVAFGALAAVFALLGVYGVTARSVARRTREMGIRVALGAERGKVLGLILKQGVRLALYGVAMGLVVAAAAGSLVDDLLFGVDATDPLTFAATAILVAAAALLASLAPGRRATRVDPMVALRAE